MARKQETRQEQQTQARQAVTYTKQQYRASVKFADHKDLIEALLEEGVAYTVEQVQEQIQQFLNQEVK